MRMKTPEVQENLRSVLRFRKNNPHMKLSEVAVKLGISYNQLSYLLYIHPAGKLEYKKIVDNEKKNGIKRKVAGGRGYSEDFKTEVMESVFKDRHISKVAKKFGIMSTTVYTWLKEKYPDRYYEFVNDNITRKATKLSDESYIKYILSEIDKGKTLSEVCKENGLNTSSMCSLLRNYRNIYNAFNRGVEYGKSLCHNSTDEDKMDTIISLLLEMKSKKIKN